MRSVKIEFKWALLFSIAMLAWMLLEKTLGWHDEKIADHFWLTMLSLPIGFLMYILAMREKRRRIFDKKLTWSQGFYTGLKVTLFVMLLSPGVQYVTHNFITPEYFNNVIDYSVTNNLMTMDKANAYFNIQNYVLQSALGAMGFGLVASAIVAIFMRRK